MLGRAERRWGPTPSWVRVISDPYLFYTASLLPIVWIVSSTTTAGDFWASTALGGTALGAQLLLGYVGVGRHLQARVGWQLLRLVPPLAFVAIASRTVGGSSLPLIPLFIPVVAGAAAAGKVQGAVATSVAVAVMLVPDLASFGQPTGIGLRGMTLAGVTIVVALGTRRIVRALEGALAISAALAATNASLHAEVAELAIRDPLTGLYNRRHFDAALDRVLAVHRRERLGGGRPLSAIMFDLDRFGLFNKEHGHQVGDIVLKDFADVLASRFRASDLLARIGGEEFIVVLDDADRAAAVSAADEVRALLAERSVLAEDGTELRVTVSAG